MMGRNRLVRFLSAIAATGLIAAGACGCAAPGNPAGGSAVQGSAAQDSAVQGNTVHGSPEEIQTAKIDHSMELLYADQFSVDYYDNGCALITIKDSGSYLVVPAGKEPPKGLSDDITVIRQPLSHIYLAATSAMDSMRCLDGISQITLSGTDASGWYIEEAKAAMEEGKMIYAGKYNAPDYELILSKSCDLAIESTMIHHAPEVKEQLEQLGIPVLVERSSYESHPLGRMEWLKLYGVLLGKEDQAQERFQQTLDRLAPVLDQEGTGKTVAFFYITSNGGVNVRKPGDYISKLIGMAGGEYVFQDLGGEENALSTMNLQMEAFYAGAKDADLLIYNSAVDGGLRTLDELLEKNEVLAEFRAVQEGNVWCTGQDLFQSSMGLGDLLLDIHTVLTQEDPEPESLTYLYRLTKEG